MPLDEIITLLEFDLGLTRSQLAVQSGWVYYKITFIFKNQICTIVRSSDGEEMRFRIGGIDLGDSYNNFVTLCHDLSKTVR